MTPAAVDKSNAAEINFAAELLAFILFIASITRCSVLPLITTVAPSRANVSAMAKPIPAVEPVTNTVLSVNFRSILFLLNK